uniref:Uncharacterized protein n=1 Tax=Globodera pallida TaxID=36090 RepID=A0A183CBQ1_GLOPA
MTTSSGDKFDEDVQHHRRHNHHHGRLHQHKRRNVSWATESESSSIADSRARTNPVFENTPTVSGGDHNLDSGSTPITDFLQQIPVRQLDVLATDCCASGGLCTVDDIEALCCRTMDCLAQCYGPSFTARIQSRFRYADILLRAHPNAEDRSNKIGRRMKKSGGKEWGEEAEDD